MYTGNRSWEVAEIRRACITRKQLSAPAVSEQSIWQLATNVCMARLNITRTSSRSRPLGVLHTLQVSRRLSVFLHTCTVLLLSASLLLNESTSLANAGITKLLMTEQSQESVKILRIYNNRHRTKVNDDTIFLRGDRTPSQPAYSAELYKRFYHEYMQRQLFNVSLAVTGFSIIDDYMWLL